MSPREENFEDTLRLVKESIVDVWEVRNQKLYDEDTCPSCQTLAGDAGPVTGGGDLRVSKMGKLMGKLQVMCMLRGGRTRSHDLRKNAIAA